jgi:hypothetical protein
VRDTTHHSHENPSPSSVTVYKPDKTLSRRN